MEPIFPEFTTQESKISQIQFPNSIFQGSLTKNGKGTGVLQFSEGQILRCSFSDFQPSDSLQLVEQGDATLIKYRDAQFLTYNQQSYYLKSSYLFAQTEQLRFAGDQEYGCQISQQSAYLGSYSDCLPNGRGIYVSLQGDLLKRYNRFEGYFVDGVREGSGCVFLGDGSLLIGQFVGGQKVNFFLFIAESGAIEFRNYQNDVLKDRYEVVGYYMQRPWELRFLQLQDLSFDAALRDFEVLRGKEEHLSRVSAEMKVIWRYCRRQTAPLSVGLISDYRVCSYMASEQLAQLARELSGLDAVLDDAQYQRLSGGGEGLSTLQPFFKQLEALKSCVIGSYPLFMFLFAFLQAKDGFSLSGAPRRRQENALLQEVARVIEAEKHRLREQRQVQAQMQREKEKQLQRQMQNSQNASLSFNQSGDAQQMQNSGSQLFGSTRDSPQLQYVNPEAEKSVILGGNAEASDNSSFSGDNAEYFNLLQAQAEQLAILPRGDSPVDNELIQRFLELLDTEERVSTDAVLTFVLDMACQNHRQVFQNTDVLDIIIREYSGNSTSQEAIIQNRLPQFEQLRRRVVSLQGFIIIVLRCHALFGYDSPVIFVNEIILPYTKNILQFLIQQLEFDEDAVKIVFGNDDEFIRQMSRKSSRKGNFSTRQSDCGSQASKLSPKSGGKQIPKILLRDSLSQLTEQESAILRVSQLPYKLQQLIELNTSFQQFLLFQTITNERIENLINYEYYIDIQQLCQSKSSLSDLFLLVFSQENPFKFDTFSNNAQFYYQMLTPFLVKFSGYQIDYFSTERPVEFQKNLILQELQNYQANYIVVQQLLTCCLLKAEFQVSTKKVEDIVEESSDNQSIRSFASIADSQMSYNSAKASGKMSFQREKELFDRSWDEFDDNQALKMVDGFIKLCQEQCYQK